MKQLKPEYQALQNKFFARYADRDCTCSIRPPCAFCAHEGNPANLEENSDAWVQENKVNKKELQKEIEELQKKLEQKQKALAAIPDKWEPPAGEFYVNHEGVIVHAPSCDSTRLFGTEYPTQEQAEEALEAMHIHNNLLAYVAQAAPDWKPDWSNPRQEKGYVALSSLGLKLWACFVTNTSKSGGTVYMPVPVAEQLVHKLNTGEVELWGKKLQ